MRYELPAEEIIAEELSQVRDKPYLVVDSGDLPATARKLRDLLSHSGRFFDRGVPVKLVVHPSTGDPPMALSLTPRPNRIRSA